MFCTISTDFVLKCCHEFTSISFIMTICKYYNFLNKKKPLNRQTPYNSPSKTLPNSDYHIEDNIRNLPLSLLDEFAYMPLRPTAIFNIVIIFNIFFYHAVHVIIIHFYIFYHNPIPLQIPIPFIIT